MAWSYPDRTAVPLKWHRRWNERLLHFSDAVHFLTFSNFCEGIKIALMQAMSKGKIIPLFKQAAADWSEDHATRLSAALAYYTMLSIAPLLVILVKFVGVWYRNSEVARKHVTDYLQNFIGPQSAQALQTMTEKAGQPGSGILAT